MSDYTDIAAGEYQLTELDESQIDEWDSFVEINGGTFFHLTGWKSIIENVAGHRTYYLICRKYGRIVAVLPLAQVKSLLFGNALISLPFLVYGGPVSSDMHGERLLLSAAEELGKSIGADYLELRNSNSNREGLVSTEIYATFVKRIHPDPEANLQEIPRKQRAMIRKGIKGGLEAHIDDGVERLYGALLDCKRNLGTPFFDAAYLRAVKEEFGDRVEVLTVVKGRDVVASVMSFRFRNQILPYYGGGGDLARDLAGNDYMYWAVMEKACLAGVEVFDFGRSMIGSGAYRFKKHWGFEPSVLSYEYLPLGKSDLPNLNPSNPKYRFLINAWKKLPLAVASRLGPPLARRIG